MNIIEKIKDERGDFCENCLADGRRTKIDAHHAFFKSKHPELANEAWNIVLLCHDKCHQEGKNAVHNGNDKLRKKCENIALERKRNEHKKNPLIF